jgi:hypothetical protein
VDEGVGRSEHERHVVAKSEEPDSALEPHPGSEPAPPRELGAMPHNRKICIP